MNSLGLKLQAGGSPGKWGFKVAEGYNQIFRKKPCLLIGVNISLTHLRFCVYAIIRLYFNISVTCIRDIQSLAGISISTMSH